MDIHNKNQILNQSISKLQVEFILIDHGLCPDWSRKTHKRRRDSVYLILDGKGEITINGKTIYPQKNNMVLLPKNSMVSLHSENETCYNKYWCDFIMHFDGISLFDVIDFPYMIELSDISRALEVFTKLDELHLKTDAASAFMLNALLLELLSIFLQNDTREKEAVVADNPFVKEMKKFINENISEPLFVGTLAKKMRFNEKYFIDVFKKNFGTTPARYIKNVRLEKAKSDLLYTDKSLLKISDETGYSSTQKLGRDFKIYTGLSPSEFRREFKS